MIVTRRLFSHAKHIRAGVSGRSIRVKKQHQPAVLSQSGWPLRSSTSRYTLIFLGTGISFYAFYKYFAAGDDQGKKFQPYALSERRVYSTSSSIFRLKPQQKVDWSQQWQDGLWSVEIKQPQLQIAREYTPLPAEISQGTKDAIGLAVDHRLSESLEFWIRREPHGEVSNYLHKLKLNDSVEIRGPKSQIAIPQAREFVFIAGGTGIAPAIQLAHALLVKHENAKNLPKISILWANRSRQDCLGGVSDSKSGTSSGFLSKLFTTTTHAASISAEKAYLVTRLDSLKKAFDGKLQVDYYVDDENSRIHRHDVLSRLSASNKAKDDTSKRVVMVCGPDGFLAHFAGPKRWSNGRQIQGEVIGVLQDAGKTGWDVIKL